MRPPSPAPSWRYALMSVPKKLLPLVSTFSSPSVDGVIAYQTVCVAPQLVVSPNSVVAWLMSTESLNGSDEMTVALAWLSLAGAANATDGAPRARMARIRTNPNKRRGGCRMSAPPCDGDLAPRPRRERRLSPAAFHPRKHANHFWRGVAETTHRPRRCSLGVARRRPRG